MQPTHTHRLFLPLADVDAELLTSSGAIKEFLDRASAFELAAVLLMQNLPNLLRQNASLDRIERMLADAAQMVVESAATPGHPRFVDQLAQRFDPQLFTRGLQLLAGAGR